MSADDCQQETKLDEQLALVISSEITIKVLVALVERSASPKQVATALGLKVPTVSHHVKKLERMGLIELVEEKEVRGAVQHIYRAVIRPIVSDEEWEKLGIEERQRFSIWIVQMILVDAARSFEARLFDARADNHLSRTPMVVDEQGAGEVAEIQNQALSDIIEVAATSADRMVSSGEPGIDFIAAMMCFELPEPSIGLARSR
ncbi:MAG TPA: winged helix-turn-helix domain-containing protein [Solirubrobacterales bacterium]